MFGETGIFFPYMKNFSQEIQQLEDYCRTHKPDDPMDVFTQTSNISDYDLGCEGDLFKAPEAVVEEPILTIDPITAAMNMMSSGKDVITSEVFELANFGSLENNQQRIDKAFYDCEKDLIVKPAMDSSLSDIMDIKNVPIVAKTDEGLNQIWEDKVIPDLLFQKSLSSGNLSSMEWMSSSAMIPRLLDFSTVDFGVTYGMRRAYSEGDIQNLGNKNTNQVQSPLDRIIGSCSSEARRQKLSRYRNKKTKRNFGRKIKYACRKALADSQPRIRGRFAKTDESPREVLTDQQI